MADSLADFAAATSAAPRCAVCSLPEAVRKQVEAARDQRISDTVVSRWLNGLGYSATRNQLSRHRVQHMDAS